ERADDPVVAEVAAGEPLDRRVRARAAGLVVAAAGGVAVDDEPAGEGDLLAERDVWPLGRRRWLLPGHLEGERISRGRRSLRPPRGGASVARFGQNRPRIAVA